MTLAFVGWSGRTGVDTVGRVVRKGRHPSRVARARAVPAVMCRYGTRSGGSMGVDMSSVGRRTVVVMAAASASLGAGSGVIASCGRHVVQRGAVPQPEADQAHDEPGRPECHPDATGEHPGDGVRGGDRGAHPRCGDRVRHHRRPDAGIGLHRLRRRGLGHRPGEPGLGARHASAASGSSSTGCQASSAAPTRLL